MALLSTWHVERNFTVMIVRSNKIDGYNKSPVGSRVCRVPCIAKKSCTGS